MGQLVSQQPKREARVEVAVKGKPFQPRAEEPFTSGVPRAFGGKKSAMAQVSKVDWQSDKLTSEQGRFLNRVFTEFGQFLAPQLTPLLQLRVMVEFEEAVQKPFKEFLDHFPTQTPLAVFSLNEKNKGLIAFDLLISYAILDYLMGGKGEVLDDTREFTEIESALFLNQLLSRFVAAYTEAWKDITPISPKVENLDFSANRLTLYSYEETVLAARFMLRVGIMSGPFEIALPLKYVRTILPRNPDQFATQTEVRKTQESPTSSAPIVGRKIENMAVNLTVELGKSEIYFQKLLGLEEGDVIRLETGRAEPLRIKVAGRTKFLGRPGVSDKKMAIRITDIVQEGDETFDDG